MDKIGRIFVTGIYGVGKSALCRYLEERYEIEYLVASQLIYSYLQKQPPLDKRISGIEQNQYVLVKALKEHPVGSSNQVLEGHSCLLNQRNEIEYIPETIFDELCLSGILLLTRNILNIVETLQNRDQIKYDANVLERLQCAEIEYVKILSKKLDVPLIEIRSENIEDVVKLQNTREISNIFGLKHRVE